MTDCQWTGNQWSCRRNSVTLAEWETVIASEFGVSCILSGMPVDMPCSSALAWSTILCPIDLAMSICVICNGIDATDTEKTVKWMWLAFHQSKRCDSITHTHTHTHTKCNIGVPVPRADCQVQGRHTTSTGQLPDQLCRKPYHQTPLLRSEHNAENINYPVTQLIIITRRHSQSLNLCRIAVP